MTASGTVIAGAPSARAGETAATRASRPAHVAAAILLTANLLGCGPSDAERQAAEAQVSVERARLEPMLAEQEARVRRLQEQLERETLQQERDQVPLQHGPGDFPTRLRPREWSPDPDPGQQRARDPRTPSDGR